MNPVSQGGLGMIDIDSRMRSLRLSWLPKILNDSEKPWKYICKFWLNKVGGVPLCLNLNCSSADTISLCKKHKLPLFYLDLLSTWADIYNTNSKYMDEALYFKDCVGNGILQAKHC